MEALIIIGGFVGIFSIYSLLQSYREFLLEEYNLNLFDPGQIFGSTLIVAIIGGVAIFFTELSTANIVVLLTFAGLMIIGQFMQNIPLAGAHGFWATIIQLTFGFVIAFIMLIILMALMDTRQERRR